MFEALPMRLSTLTSPQFALTAKLIPYSTEYLRATKAHIAVQEWVSSHLSVAGEEADTEFYQRLGSSRWTPREW